MPILFEVEIHCILSKNFISFEKIWDFYLKATSLLTFTFLFYRTKAIFLALFVSFFFCSYLCKSIFISQSAKDKHDKEQHKWNRRKRIAVRRKECGPTHFSSTPSKKWSQNQLRPCCPYTITSFYYLTFKKYVYIPTNSHRMPIEQNTE